MKPRNLRHRQEKSAKLLVIIQKYLPDCSCSFAAEKGTEGHLVVHLGSSDDPQKLGSDLESKGFAFTRMHNPWLGLITYKGTKGDQPSVIIESETTADRLYRGAETTAEAYSFKA
ncbi:hypothetical protein [Rubellicoccus peritrichatus]|uniref:Uncharacterized protein n=1 Tax=Rubellicoccus peritrichatus TaxID=3080537 RepID=A0AAQ3QWC8_9BACT|nr:hypothetical protein [Puniceicoccus sp. CR14]WOO41762.1 hypothetical protein RZN69_01580 [Puniceicoccus sp. CR14]